MSTTRESVLESMFVQKVRRKGGMAIKLIPVIAGLPDRLVLLPPGDMYLVELKAENGRRSAVQRLWHAKAARIGITVVTLTGKQEILDWLEKVTDDST